MTLRFIETEHGWLNLDQVRLAVTDPTQPEFLKLYADGTLQYPRQLLGEVLESAWLDAIHGTRRDHS